LKNLTVRSIGVFIISVIAVFFIQEFTIEKVFPSDLYQTDSQLFKKLKERGFGEREILRAFSDPRARIDRKVLKKAEGAKRVDYFSDEYKLFTPDSIARGKRVLAEKNFLLQEAENIFGIPKQISVSIFRQESNLGDYKGEFAVFNSLNTLYIFRKRNWAEDELINFFVLCKKHQYDPLSIMGSWAGCFGLFQFIPSSFLNFAIDGDGDGKINLFEFPDALKSAANYLKANGWNLDDKGAIRRALFRYNKSEEYGKSILAYAEALDGNATQELLVNLRQFRSFIEEKYGYKIEKNKNKVSKNK
jgi:membrane-bound lytic murein transglycosylase B